MNSISTTLNNFNIAKPGLLQSSLSAEGSWVGRGINMIRLIPQQMQSNTFNTFKTFGVVVGVNALFVLGMHFFVNHLDHRLENQKEGLDSDQRVFKVLLLNGVVLGGLSLVFNGLLSKYTKFPLKGSRLVCIATTNVAIRVLVNRFVTNLMSKKKVVEEGKSQEDKGLNEKVKESEKTSPKPLTPVSLSLKETLKNPETDQNGNPSDVKIQDVDPKKEENPVQTLNIATEIPVDSENVFSQGMQGEENLEIKPEEQPSGTITEKPEEKPTEEAQTEIPPSTESESQPQTNEDFLNDQESQSTVEKTTSTEGQNQSFEFTPVMEDVDTGIPLTINVESIAKSQEFGQKAANDTNKIKQDPLSVTSIFDIKGIGQLALSNKSKSKISQSAKASTAPAKSAEPIDDYMQFLMFNF